VSRGANPPTYSNTGRITGKQAGRGLDRRGANVPVATTDFMTLRCAVSVLVPCGPEHFGDEMKAFVIVDAVLHAGFMTVELFPWCAKTRAAGYAASR
jgi:hypothetical protein